MNDLSHIMPSIRDHAVPVSSLRFMPSNPRVHDARSIKAIRASLTTFKQTKPIVLASDGKTVIAGNGTLEAGIALGWTMISAVTSDIPANSKRAKAYAIADNRTTDLSSFDTDIVSSVMRSLDDSLAVATGFVREIMTHPPLPVPTAEDEREQEAAQVVDNRIPATDIVQSGSVPVSASDTIETEDSYEPRGDTVPTLPLSSRYDLTFSDERRQERFRAFAEELRSTYPNHTTTGDRLVAWIDERASNDER